MNAPRPLEGVRVLDLSRYIPGNLLTRKLGDLGAEVVKVEGPGGDTIRLTPPFVDGTSLYHLQLNRGKRSVMLDTRTAAGKNSLERLARAADVIVEVNAGGHRRRDGLDLGVLRAERPMLVIVSVSGFGQTGPFAGLPAHGLNIEALSGTLPVQWENGRPVFGDLRFSAGNAIELAAVNGALATVAALFRARAEGTGAWLDVSCWDAMVEAPPALSGDRVRGSHGRILRAARARSPLRALRRQRRTRHPVLCNRAQVLGRVLRSDGANRSLAPLDE